MNYVLFGEEPLLLKQKIDQIKKDAALDDLAWTYYDLETTSLSNIIDEANSVSLFATKRGIYVDNAYIFTATTNKKLPPQDPTLLEKYLNNPNPNTILIFGVNKDKIDVRKKISKKIKEIGKIIDCSVANNELNVIKDMFKPCSISDQDCRLFKERVGNNLGILWQEANKLVTYKDYQGVVTKDDIKKLTSPNIDLDLFHLLDNIINNHQKQALESYHEMIKYGEEPFVILISLANQFRLFYQVKELAKQGLSENKIAEYLKIHPYRVKKSLEKRNQFSFNQLTTYLERLADLDMQIKSGLVDKYLGLELFILKES